MILTPKGISRIVFIVLLATSLVIGQECPACSDGGDCIDGECVCKLHRAGDDCSLYFSQVLGDVFVTYCAVADTLALITIAICICFLVLSHLQKLDIEFTQQVALGILAFGNLCYFILWTLHVAGLRDGNNELSVFAFMYSSSLIAVLALQVILWAEIRNAVRKGEKQYNITRTRHIFYTCIGILFVTSFAPLLSSAVNPNTLEILYYGVVGFFTILLAIGYLIVGSMTLKLLYTQNSTKKISRKQKRFVRITVFILVSSSLLLIGSIYIIIVNLILRLQKQPYGWVGGLYGHLVLQYLLIASLLGNYGCILYIDRKKKMSTTSSGDSSSQTPNHIITPNENNENNGTNQ